MNWTAVLQALRTEAREAQDKANRLSLKGYESEAAEQTAELLRVLVRALSAGVGSDHSGV